jgi:hypothetical protein
MIIEIAGFLSGIGVVCGAGLIVMRRELRAALRAASGRKAAGRPPGNALIWPSR